MDLRGVQEMLLGLPVPAPFNRDGKQLITWFYGATAVFARNKLEMDEMSTAVIRAILVADPVRWPSLMHNAVGWHRFVWDYNGGGEPHSTNMTTEWWTMAGVLKNRISAEWQL